MSSEARLRLTVVRWPEFALLYCAAIWGSTFYIVRDAVAELHPLTLIGWRFTLAGAALLPFVLAGAKRSFAHDGITALPPGRSFAPPLRSHWEGYLLGLIIFILYAAQTWGLVYTSAANSAFITGLFIIFIPPLAFLMHREVPGGTRLLAIAVALAGLYLLTGGIAGLNRGDLLTLIAAATYALHVLITGRAVSRGLDPLTLACQQMLVCGLLGLASAALLHQPLALPNAHVTGMVLFLTLLPTLSAYLLQLIAQKRVDALRTALIFTMEPVFGALFAWTLGGEAFIPLRAAGGLLIVAAMFVSEISVVTKAALPPSDSFV
jgi:drug/metabolite transporter (DMT)-like permease